MKLLSHNMLTSTCLKGVNEGYPLGIKAKDVQVNEVDFNPEFITKVMAKIDWPVLYKAADTIGHADGLPKQLPEDWEKDDKFLRKAHHVLVGVDVIEGELICPETGRKFPINNGIPNMLLNESEVQM